MAYQLTKDDLIEHLREQVDFLKASAAAFDAGTLAEAKRLAVTLRVLLHDTPQSKSVLAQLGEQERLWFMDTGPSPFPGNLLGHHGLVLMQMGGDVGGTYVARCNGPPDPEAIVRRKRFGEWWTETVLIDSDRHEFSRKNHVLGLANKEGGGHVDPKLDEKYARLTRNNSLGWMYEDKRGPPEPFGSPIPCGVRQITEEVLISLKSLACMHGVLEL